jgi:hypothetical protein
MFLLSFNADAFAVIFQTLICFLGSGNKASVISFPNPKGMVN